MARNSAPFGVPSQWTAFRVLHVQPGTWDDSIQCKLEIVDLDSCPNFEALSYAWGTAWRHDMIRLNDFDGFVRTKNAFDAVRRLRYSDRARTIWVDFICISQGDILERQ
jgi:hypothetical protein